MLLIPVELSGKLRVGAEKREQQSKSSDSTVVKLCTRSLKDEMYPSKRQTNKHTHNIK